jgi:CMP-N-acetylneuraminic acid synthetase
MKHKIVGLIPVKGTSERIPRKNLRPFADTNLYELKLKQLQKVQGFSDLIVSSEDETILETARKYGYNTHKRDPKYSTGHVPMSEVYSYVASEIHGEHIAWINVTNPLADGDVYTSAIWEYENQPESCDCLLSAYEIKDNFFFRGKPVNFEPYPWARSQDLEGLYSMSFVINILKRDDMIRWGSCVGDSPHFYLLDQVTSWDIDFQADFDFCEAIFHKQKKESNSFD